MFSIPKTVSPGNNALRFPALNQIQEAAEIRLKEVPINGAPPKALTAGKRADWLKLLIREALGRFHLSNGSILTGI